MNKPLSEIMCASDIQTLDSWLLLVKKVKALEQSIKEKDEAIAELEMKMENQLSCAVEMIMTPCKNKEHKAYLKNSCVFCLEDKIAERDKQILAMRNCDNCQHDISPGNCIIDNVSEHMSEWCCNSDYENWQMKGLNND